MTRQADIDDLHDQAVRHALIAERMGFVATAQALWTLAREAEQERQDLAGFSYRARFAREAEPVAALWTGGQRLAVIAGG